MTKGFQEFKEMNARMYREPIPDTLPSQLSIYLGGRRLNMGPISFHYGGYKLDLIKMQWLIPQADGTSKMVGLRYGTNPHQRGAVYRPKNPLKLFMGNMGILKTGKGSPSSTNIEDGYRGLKLCSYFDTPTIVEEKHLNPSGFSTMEISKAETKNSKLVNTFKDSWKVDERASYGCTLSANVPIDVETAEEMDKYYIECVFAPGYLEGTLEVFSRKKDRRIVEVPHLSHLLSSMIPYEFKVFGDVVTVEDTFSTPIRRVEDLKNSFVVTSRSPTEKEFRQLTYAWWACCEKRSNGVVLWKGNKALAFAVGQQDRIGSIELAYQKAEAYGHDTNGSVLASDGFMLKDNAALPIKKGTTAVVQPGGGVADKELIDEFNSANVAEVFTGFRAFRHY